MALEPTLGFSVPARMLASRQFPALFCGGSHAEKRNASAGQTKARRSSENKLVGLAARLVEGAVDV